MLFSFVVVQYKIVQNCTDCYPFAEYNYIIFCSNSDAQTTKGRDLMFHLPNAVFHNDPVFGGYFIELLPFFYSYMTTIRFIRGHTGQCRIGRSPIIYSCTLKNKDGLVDSKQFSKIEAS